VFSAEPLEDQPGVATARQQGVDWVAMGWRGLALPKGAPAAKARELESICLEIGNSPEYADFMQTTGFGLKVLPADEFTAFLEQQDAQWKDVVEAAGYAE
jgi:putative tricarboxylic transport membrane protein